MLASIMTESDLEMAERHVREGAGHITRQSQIVDELTRDGHHELAREAAGLLRQFEELQVEHLAHRDRLLSESTED